MTTKKKTQEVKAKKPLKKDKSSKKSRDTFEYESKGDPEQ